MSILNHFDLSGKTALVTGAKRGIGFGIAHALAQAGADIVGVSASLQKGSDIEKAVSQEGRRFSAHAVDFSDRNAVQQFADTLNAEGPQIDILVNNAGTIKRKPAAEHEDALWDEVINVNLSSQFVLSREIGR